MGEDPVELFGVVREWVENRKQFFAVFVLVPVCFLAWVAAQIAVRLRR
jgi:hypothetical protein